MERSSLRRHSRPFASAHLDRVAGAATPTAAADRAEDDAGCCATLRAITGSGARKCLWFHEMRLMRCASAPPRRTGRPGSLRRRAARPTATSTGVRGKRRRGCTPRRPSGGGNWPSGRRAPGPTGDHGVRSGGHQSSNRLARRRRHHPEATGVSAALPPHRAHRAPPRRLSRPHLSATPRILDLQTIAGAGVRGSKSADAAPAQPSLQSSGAGDRTQAPLRCR